MNTVLIVSQIVCLLLTDGFLVRHSMYVRAGLDNTMYSLYDVVTSGGVY